MAPPIDTRAAEIAVLGAGIVGLACADALRRRGRQVLLVDAAGPGAETSYGNAGSISVGNVLPQSTPGIVRRGLRMLIDPRAPLKFDWPRLPAYWRWLLAFVRSGRREGILPIVDALHAINHASRGAWLDWAARRGAEDLVAHTGYLHVYRDEATFAAGAWERALMQERGVRFDVLDRRGLAALEPRLGEGFRHAVFQPESLAMRDPGGFCARVAEGLAADGVGLRRARVVGIAPGPHGYRLQTEDGGAIDAGRVVLCAGAWSTGLLAALGVRLPLVPARGYHLMFPTQDGVVQRPTLWAERYLVVSPMRGGIRMTSIKELTRLGAPARYPLIRRLAPEAEALFPGLRAEAASEWVGNRPCTPDSLPVIDKVPGEGIWIATGHGHLGLTQAPITGTLVAQMMADEPTALDIRPYRLARFAG